MHVSHTDTVYVHACVTYTHCTCICTCMIVYTLQERKQQTVSENYTRCSTKVPLNTESTTFMSSSLLPQYIASGSLISFPGYSILVIIFAH